MTVSPGFCLQGKGQGGALRLGEKTLTVPQGSVLAYKRKQLVFKKEGWGKQRLKEAGGEQGYASPGKRNQKGKTIIRQPWLLYLFREKQHFSAVQGTHIPPPIATSKQGPTEILL